MKSALTRWQLNSVNMVNQLHTQANLRPLPWKNKNPTTKQNHNNRLMGKTNISMMTFLKIVIIQGAWYYVFDAILIELQPEGHNMTTARGPAIQNKDYLWRFHLRWYATLIKKKKVGRRRNGGGVLHIELRNSLDQLWSYWHFAAVNLRPGNCSRSIKMAAWLIWVCLVVLAVTVHRSEGVVHCFSWGSWLSIPVWKSCSRNAKWHILICSCYRLVMSHSRTF